MSKKIKSMLDEPEKIDAIINTRLKQFPAKGGTVPSKQVGWTEEEYEMMDAVIWDYMMNKGYSREDTAQAIQNRWDITISTARKYITDSIKRFYNNFPEETLEERRKKFIQRCEAIFKDAITDNQKQTAIKALEQIGKASGIFQEQKDINLTGENTIHFEFN